MKGKYILVIIFCNFTPFFVGLIPVSDVTGQEIFKDPCLLMFSEAGAQTCTSTEKIVKKAMYYFYQGYASWRLVDW